MALKLETIPEDQAYTGPYFNHHEDAVTLLRRQQRRRYRQQAASMKSRFVEQFEVDLEAQILPKSSLLLRLQALMRHHKTALRGAGVLLVLVLVFLAVRSSLSTSSRRATTSSPLTSYAGFPPPENTSYRVPDTIDAFANYKHRRHTSCQISSLDLHLPFAPLCDTSQDFLDAFSGGGRFGFDTPYIPHHCDMRWFTTEEVCEIFSRFQRVIVVGDSMMRHVVGALNVLLRADLGYGAVTDWNFSEQELDDCFCNSQFDVKSCSVQGIFSTSSVLEHAPASIACTEPFDLTIEMMLKFPLDPTEVDRYTSLISSHKPSKPYAFVFGHGLWNDLDLQATLNWLDAIQTRTLDRAQYLSSTNIWPRLFISPNAAGINKPDQWIQSQGDKALQIFEHSTREECQRRGMDHMGTWNMSIQTSKHDGVHLDLKGNLVKAMGVVNWLSFVDVQSW